jgi:hypothetical protein
MLDNNLNTYLLLSRFVQICSKYLFFLMLLQYQLVRSKTDSWQQNINAQARVAYGGKNSKQPEKIFETFHTPEKPIQESRLQKATICEIQSENFRKMSLLPYVSILAPRSASYQSLEASMSINVLCTIIKSQSVTR